jgi:FkbM family methyltransferase
MAQTKVLGAHTTGVIVDTDVATLALDIKDLGVGRHLRFSGSYSAAELTRLLGYVSKDSRILVVGAHVGTFAIPLARRAATVVAIEANPRSYELLLTNVFLNGVDNVQCHQIAASSKREDLDFLLSTTNSGGSKRVPIKRDNRYYYDNPRTVAVEGHPLDQYLDGQQFEIVVMDIEGSEYFALQGMQRILASAQILAVEFMPHHLQNVSGASVEDFLDLIRPHFSTMLMPSRGQAYPASEMGPVLEKMYAANVSEDSLIFSRNDLRSG